MRKISLLPFLSLLTWFLLCCPFLSNAQQEDAPARFGEKIDDWTLARDEKGIKVYFREGGAGTNIREHKATTIIQSSPEAVAALLHQPEIWMRWAKIMRNPQVLKVNSDADYITYEEINMPSPNVDRDMVTHYIMEPLANGFICRVTNEPDFIPAKPEMVRVPIYNGLWVVKRIDNSHVEVTRVCYLELGGKLPSKLVNRNMKETAYVWLDGMRDYLEGKQ